MRRLIIFVISAVAFTALYSGLWFYQAKNIRDFAEVGLRSFAKRVGGEKSEFLYSKARVKGYPFKFEIEIDQPKLLVEDQGVILDIYSGEEISIISNITGSAFSLHLPHKIFVVRKEDDYESQWSLNYSRQPKINAKIRRSSIWPFTKNMDVSVKEFNYSDDGYSIFNVKTNKEIASSKSSFVNLNIGLEESKDSSVNLVSDLKGIRFFSPDYLLGSGIDLGEVNINADISYIGPEKLDNINGEESHLRIRELAFNSGLFTIDAKGSIDRAKDDGLPFGELQLKLSKYSNFVDHQKFLVNYIVRNSAFPIFSIKERQADSFKHFLYAISTERQDEGNGLVIMLKRNKGDDLHIGPYDLAEVMGLFKESFEQGSVAVNSEK